MKIITLAIDLAKEVFQLHGVDERGKPILRQQVRRNKLADTIQKLPPCRIVMEACGGAHYWARRFQSMGHQVQLISPQHVKPFVKGSKNDRNDAEAICEAASRPTMRYVPIKSVEQQDMQMMHRIRSKLIKERTALINQLRGLLAEYGIVMARNAATVRREMPMVLDDTANELTPLSREMLHEQYDRLVQLDDQIGQYDRRIKLTARQSLLCTRIEQVPGVGPMVATALVAAAGDGKVFRNGRQMAAWVGLVPRQCSSGGKQRLLGITKRGDTNLRTLLIHGARAVVLRAEFKTDPLSQWINRIRQQSGVNVAAVALANKNARIIWAMMNRDEDYRQAV